MGSFARTATHNDLTNDVRQPGNAWRAGLVLKNE